MSDKGGKHLDGSRSAFSFWNSRLHSREALPGYYCKREANRRVKANQGNRSDDPINSVLSKEPSHVCTQAENGKYAKGDDRRLDAG